MTVRPPGERPQRQVPVGRLIAMLIVAALVASARRHSGSGPPGEPIVGLIPIVAGLAVVVWAVLDGRVGS